MKNIHYIFCPLLLWILPAQAQTALALRAEADSLFSEGAYGYALPVLLRSLENEPLDPSLNLKTGICYMHSRSEKEQAAPYFVKTTSTFDSSAVKNSAELAAKWADIYDSLGDVYQWAGETSKALGCFMKSEKICFASPKPNAILIDKLRWKIEMCGIGTESVALSGKKKDQRSGKKSKMGYAPVVDKSTGAATRVTPKAWQKAATEKHYFENDSRHARQEIQSAAMPASDSSSWVGPEEATIAASVDGQIILIYREEKNSAGIYSTDLLGNSWTLPQKLSKPVNPAGWEQNECISSDGNLMYFTSSRPGGMGGSDIYCCHRLPSGEWGPAVNLGAPVNTSYNETAPFIYPDEKVLFFASDRYQKKDHYRLYSSMTSDSGNWSKPINIGYPKGSKSDFEISASVEKSAPLAENLIRKPKNENFLITFFDHRSAGMTVLKGLVYGPEKKPVPALKITVTDNETGKVTSVYNSNTGHYEFILPGSKNNNITYEAAGYIFHSENANLSPLGTHYELDRPVEMEPVQRGSCVALNNIFFEADGTSISPLSDVETGRICNFLRSNPGLAVEIYYASGNPEADKLNPDQNTPKARALISKLTERGIDPARLKAESPAKPHKAHRRWWKKKKKQTADQTPQKGLYMRVM